MIVVASPVDVASGAEGYRVDVDDDRRVYVWPSVSDGVLIEIYNGTQRKSVGMTRETAEALFSALSGWFYKE